MMRSGDYIFLLVLVLSFAWAADERAARLGDERERRWNTPPELTPQSVVKTSSVDREGEPRSRLLSLVPVTATVSLSAGRDNNAHSVSLGAGLDGISLSGSNAYNRPGSRGIDGSSVSASNSATFSAGLSGISSASAGAYSDGNNAETESHSFSLGQATAASFGMIENGRAVSGAVSAVGTSSVASGGNLEQFLSQTGERYPTWNNVGPNDQRDDRRFGFPRPHWTRPTTLSIDARDTFVPERKPTIRVYKWRPDRPVFPRPGISIELRPHESWNVDRAPPTGLQIGVRNESPYEVKRSDGDVLDDLAQAVGDLLDIA